MVGDHLALDLLDTEARISGEPVDYWISRGDVRAWPASHPALPASLDRHVIDPALLLAVGTVLRTQARTLIGQFKDGTVADPGALNAHLHDYDTALHLKRDTAGRLGLNRIAQCDRSRRRSARSPTQWQGGWPKAIQPSSSNASIRNACFGFTIGPRREWRWCGMALCGHRYKAARSRERRGGHAGLRQCSKGDRP